MGQLTILVILKHASPKDGSISPGYQTTLYVLLKKKNIYRSILP